MVSMGGLDNDRNGRDSVKTEISLSLTIILHNLEQLQLYTLVLLYLNKGISKNITYKKTPVPKSRDTTN
jgi:hypothetical protein